MSASTVTTCPCGATLSTDPILKKGRKANHLYIHDDGRTYCGAQLPMSFITYRRQWSDLGPMGEDGTINCDGFVVMCESFRYRKAV